MELCAAQILWSNVAVKLSRESGKYFHGNVEKFFLLQDPQLFLTYLLVYDKVFFVLRLLFSTCSARYQRKQLARFQTADFPLPIFIFIFRPPSPLQLSGGGCF